MKIMITTLAISTSIIIGGCNKTKTLNNSTETVQNESQQKMDVNVEIDDGEIVVMINGEKQVIDMSDATGTFEFETIDGEASIAVMVLDDKDGEPMHWMNFGDNGNVQVRMVINGEEVEGLPEDMMKHVMEMIQNGEHGEMDMSFGWTTEAPEHGQMKMMRVMGGGGPEDMDEMRNHMKRMRGGPEEMGEMRRHIVRMRRSSGDMDEEHDYVVQFLGGPEGMPGQWRGIHEEHDNPEEHQFMEELDLLDEISSYMSHTSMVMLGIHMIRDELEPEERLEALQRIIDEAHHGSTSRNAAMIVAIETLQELDRRDEAADLMVELVLTN